MNALRMMVDYMGWLWYWRGRCPKTVEGAAEDFLGEDKNPPRVLGHFRDLPESAREDHEARALRGRIELIYGLTHRWNRDLLRACGTDNPAEAAERIFNVFWSKLGSYNNIN